MKTPIEAVKAVLKRYGYTNYKIQQHSTFLRVVVGMGQQDFFSTDPEKVEDEMDQWLQTRRQ